MEIDLESSELPNPTNTQRAVSLSDAVTKMVTLLVNRIEDRAITDIHHAVLELSNKELVRLLRRACTYQDWTSVNEPEAQTLVNVLWDLSLLRVKENLLNALSPAQITEHTEAQARHLAEGLLTKVAHEGEDYSKELAGGHYHLKKQV